MKKSNRLLSTVLAAIMLLALVPTPASADTGSASTLIDLETPGAATGNGTGTPTGTSGDSGSTLINLEPSQGGNTAPGTGSGGQGGSSSIVVENGNGNSSTPSTPTIVIPSESSPQYTPDQSGVIVPGGNTVNGGNAPAGNTITPVDPSNPTGSQMPVLPEYVYGTADAENSPLSLSMTADATTLKPGDIVNITALVSLPEGVEAGSVIFHVGGSNLKAIPVTGGVATLRLRITNEGGFNVYATYIAADQTAFPFADVLALTYVAPEDTGAGEGGTGTDGTGEGDSNEGSGNDDGVITTEIPEAALRISLDAGAPQADVGETRTLTATIKSTSAEAAGLSGEITFFINGSALATSPLNMGTAHASWVIVRPGMYEVTAAYFATDDNETISVTFGKATVEASFPATVSGFDAVNMIMPMAITVTGPHKMDVTPDTNLVVGDKVSITALFDNTLVAASIPVTFRFDAPTQSGYNNETKEFYATRVGSNIEAVINATSITDARVFATVSVGQAPASYFKVNWPTGSYKYGEKIQVSTTFENNVDPGGQITYTYNGEVKLANVGETVEFTATASGKKMEVFYSETTNAAELKVTGSNINVQKSNAELDLTISPASGLKHGDPFTVSITPTSGSEFSAIDYPGTFLIKYNGVDYNATFDTPIPLTAVDAGVVEAYYFDTSGLIKPWSTTQTITADKANPVFSFSGLKSSYKYGETISIAPSLDTPKDVTPANNSFYYQLDNTIIGSNRSYADVPITIYADFTGGTKNLQMTYTALGTESIGSGSAAATIAVVKADTSVTMASKSGDWSTGYTFTASVASEVTNPFSGASTPSGTIALLVHNGTNFVEVASGNVDSAGKATIPYNPGTHSMDGKEYYFHYSGDTNYNVSASSKNTMTDKQITAILSVSPSTLEQPMNTFVDLILTVSPELKGTAVTFTDNGAEILSSKSVSGNTITIAVLLSTLGNHNFQAVYTPNNGVAPITTNTVTVDAVQHTTTFDVKLNPDTLVYGKTFEASVEMDSALYLLVGKNPEGTFDYTFNGTPQTGAYSDTHTYNANTVGTLPVSVTYTPISATYTLATATETANVTINKAHSEILVALDGDSASRYTLSGTIANQDVTTLPPWADAPGGKVQLYLYNNGSPTTNPTFMEADIHSDGTYAFTYTPAAGESLHDVYFKVTYGGDANYLAASDATGQFEDFEVTPTFVATDKDSSTVLTNNDSVYYGTKVSVALTLEPNLQAANPIQILDNGTPLTTTTSGNTVYFEDIFAPGDHIFTYTYTLLNGTVVTSTDSIKVTVKNPEPTLALTANPSSISYGESFTVNATITAPTDVAPLTGTINYALTDVAANTATQAYGTAGTLTAFTVGTFNLQASYVAPSSPYALKDSTTPTTQALTIEKALPVIAITNDPTGEGNWDSGYKLTGTVSNSKVATTNLPTGVNLPSDKIYLDIQDNGNASATRVTASLNVDGTFEFNYKPAIGTSLHDIAYTITYPGDGNYTAAADVAGTFKDTMVDATLTPSHNAVYLGTDDIYVTLVLKPSFSQVTNVAFEHSVNGIVDATAPAPATSNTQRMTITAPALGTHVFKVSYNLLDGTPVEDECTIEVIQETPAFKVVHTPNTPVYGQMIDIHLEAIPGAAGISMPNGNVDYPHPLTGTVTEAYGTDATLEARTGSDTTGTLSFKALYSPPANYPLTATYVDVSIEIAKAPVSIADVAIISGDWTNGYTLATQVVSAVTNRFADAKIPSGIATLYLSTDPNDFSGGKYYSGTLNSDGSVSFTCSNIALDGMYYKVVYSGDDQYLEGTHIGTKPLSDDEVTSTLTLTTQPAGKTELALGEGYNVELTINPSVSKVGDLSFTLTLDDGTIVDLIATSKASLVGNKWVFTDVPTVTGTHTFNASYTTIAGTPVTLPTVDIKVVEGKPTFEITGVAASYYYGQKIEPGIHLVWPDYITSPEGNFNYSVDASGTNRADGLPYADRATLRAETLGEGQAVWASYTPPTSSYVLTGWSDKVMTNIVKAPSTIGASVSGDWSKGYTFSTTIDSAVPAADRFDGALLPTGKAYLHLTDANGDLITDAPLEADIDANGKATFQYNGQPLDGITCKITYEGDSNYAEATPYAGTLQDNHIVVGLTMNPAATTAYAGDTRTLTFEINPEIASGSTITFYDNGTAIAVTPVINGNKASITIAPEIGTHLFTAYYSTPAGVQRTSNSISLNVYKRQPTLSVTASVASDNSQMTVYVRVSRATGAPVPTGVVTLMINGQEATVALDATGSGSFTWANPPIGLYNITAEYPGDANNLSAKAATVTTVRQPVIITITPSPAPTAAATRRPSSGSGSASATATASPSPTPNAGDGSLAIDDYGTPLGGGGTIARFVQEDGTVVEQYSTATFLEDEPDVMLIEATIENADAYAFEFHMAEMRYFTGSHPQGYYRISTDAFTAEVPFALYSTLPGLDAFIRENETLNSGDTLWMRVSFTREQDADILAKINQRLQGASLVSDVWLITIELYDPANDMLHSFEPTGPLTTPIIFRIATTETNPLALLFNDSLNLATLAEVPVKEGAAVLDVLFPADYAVAKKD